MRSALVTLALALSAACASTTAQQPIIAGAAPAEDASTDMYEQYIDENGHVVTTHANAGPAKQSTHNRLFNHWTSASLFTR